MPTDTLNDIRIMVRRIVKATTESALTTAELDKYIDTYYIYDFPEHLKSISLWETYTFFTEANVDRYNFSSDQTYLEVRPPVYIAGYESFFSQSEAYFYRLYPKVTFNENFSGDGTDVYSFTLSNTPLLQNEFLFTYFNGATTVNLVDNPQGAASGNIIVQGVPATVYGTVNYLTGLVTITSLPSVVPSGNNNISIQYVPYVASRPQAVLFYNDQFVVRPVPDQGYKVTIEAYKRPTSLANANDVPEIRQWWQLIALGAALKIFRDRSDFENIRSFAPLHDEQLNLATRRTIIQYTTERSPTIYTEQVTGQWNQFNQYS